MRKRFHDQLQKRGTHSRKHIRELRTEVLQAKRWQGIHSQRYRKNEKLEIYLKKKCLLILLKCKMQKWKS